MQSDRQGLDEVAGSFACASGPRCPPSFYRCILEAAHTCQSDLATAHPSSLRLALCSKAGSLLNLHYPGRLHKAFLINAPSWQVKHWLKHCFSERVWRVLPPQGPALEARAPGC